MPRDDYSLGANVLNISMKLNYRLTMNILITFKVYHRTKVGSEATTGIFLKKINSTANFIGDPRT